MGRRKKNKYRIVSDGLKIEQTLYSDYCQNLKDSDIIKEILISAGFFSTLESYRNGKRKINLIPLRVHKEENA